jgi:ATP-binding protein involved in chromosome partitioning
MQAVTEEQILNALRVVQDPDLHRDIVSLGFVKDVRICEGAVAFKVELTTPACPVKDLLKRQAEQEVEKIPGVTSVSVEMTAQVRARDKAPEELIPGVKNVIAVASGKGGVGKSTVAANLAIALQRTGARVGLLDADIYGPTMPLMMGTTRRPLMTETETGAKIVPVNAHGVLMMSLGLILDPDKAVVWRGPMIASAVRQMLGDVIWGNLDYLVVDLPPGTGDASLSLAQLVPVSGVVIVTTPQAVAAEIANKSVIMFRTVSQGQGREIPILGVIENMSGSVFGSGGGAIAAEKFGVPLLGTIPLDNAVCAGGDSGIPIVLSAPETEAAARMHAIAGALAARLSVLRHAQSEEAQEPAS